MSVRLLIIRAIEQVYAEPKKGKYVTGAMVAGSGRLEGVKKSNKAWGSEKHTELAGFSRNTDRVFVKGDTAAAVTLRLISRQPAMSPTGAGRASWDLRWRLGGG